MTERPEKNTSDMNVVKLQDTGEALVNPDMGWTMHFYSNIISNYGSKLEPSDTLDDFPGLSTVYLSLQRIFRLRTSWLYMTKRLDVAQVS